MEEPKDKFMLILIVARKRKSPSLWGVFYFLESKLIFQHSGHNVAVGWCVLFDFIFTFNILAEKTKSTFGKYWAGQIAPLAW